MKWLSIGLIVTIVLLQCRLWMGEGSIKEVKSLSKAIHQEQEHIAVLTERNHRLEAEVKDLKNQLGALEERARTDLGMIKKGETFYHFPSTDTKQSKAVTDQEKAEKAGKA